MNALRPALPAALVAALLLPAAALAQTPAGPAGPPRADAPDPFLWLEEVDGARAMTWVEGQNAKAKARLEGDPRYETLLAEARAIFTAQDRIATPRFRAGGVDNLWQDDANPHGLWRHASLESYAAGTPVWTTALDMDALAKTEARNWFFHGADCLKPAEVLCLVELSDGGGDAVEIREFDTAAKAFVPGGFTSPEGKQNVAWLDPDTLLVAREWVPGEVTESGYAYVLKSLARDGTATELYRGQPTDVSVFPIVLRGEGGRAEAVIARRGITFYESDFMLLGEAAPVRLNLPKKAEYEAYVRGQAVFSLQEAYGDLPQGALVAFDLAKLKADPAAAQAQLIFAPGPRQAVQQVGATDARLVVALLEDVKGAVDVWAFEDGAWTSTRLPLPVDANITLTDLASTTDALFAKVEGFLEPTSLWLADAAAGTARQVAALPDRFDPTTHLVEQHWATSSDGAQIPYFVVRPRAAALDGQIPTLMYGYGGFEVAKPPIYMPEAGKLWMARGGAYVIANIRGGGEFGPAWHQSVLRENRQLAFDDFAAVARDLTARQITSPRRLGIYGRSNGGVLTSVAMTQHPDLWNAVVIESPLIDMLRYHKLPAGASWVGEYGDPEVPEDRAFIARYSAYQNLKAGTAYPEAYITTNTRDDRVHPGHARKFAAALEALDVPYIYYEPAAGGHANDADPQLNAARWARHYVYLMQRLMD
ncbi:prolyl oligopeptidase family protein [Phenylobacterium sp.]|uniref:prolyl oligopeptidase family serine peptidase n=1 Tax=Phenylobacterium sp. TaxID=1871053 RepID=UPI002730DB16|nr:prolyl oligopeptidase family serine peptidase [Phenylobacterium sp.]MDP1616250.1 prolyl oligopeptidase family serine peptidase [Phenylobacterium sp.]MDP1988510.1 prolyl oligopeptidase family serine peptidase [Phenylobacterium sp.]